LLFISLLFTCESTASLGTHTEKAQFELPSHPTPLFNGKNLDGWYTYQRIPEPTSKVKGLKVKAGKYLEPIGLNRDPLAVFTIVTEEGAPAIRISGEVFGILVTDQEFENYHLSLEFKWGKKRYPPRKNNKRDSGILYHSVGKEGVRGGVWMRSVELQVQEGDTGDLWCVDSTTAQVRAMHINNLKRWQYNPASSFETIDMRGERYCKKSTDAEKPYGEWNRLDIYTFGRESIHVVNGHKNMHLTEMGQIVNGNIEPLTKGKIQIQSEGAEVFYRDITIRSIEAIPNFY